ncbi:MAG: hypothetical protein EP338_01435 [Bacteroidetes bacterium]|nr:MAG: hypothetical protein EP338_01435 [Bacteroidota bacterium]
MSVVETERTGVITEFYDADAGMIREDGTGVDYEFVQHGAQVDFFNGEDVIFITITTPKGKIITKEVLKKGHN